MKKYTHAWIALKAVEYLREHETDFAPPRREALGRFVKFISRYPDTFVRGAWFPDTVISDNLQGGHTWKYRWDPNGREEKRRPPAHISCLSLVAGDALKEPVLLDLGTSDLPDRCEALSQSIRDAILITNKVEAGDVVAYNNSQVALQLLMLSHYIADAHVPPHCDARDFYTPSHIHPDLEEFWEDEVKRCHRVSTGNEQFDLDEDGVLQLKSDVADWNDSVLGRTCAMLHATSFANADTDNTHWSALLGPGNKNVWDYLVGVCRLSFQLSLDMFPLQAPPGIDYNTVKIMETDLFKEKLIQNTPNILADAVMSVALLWLATWERWELLAKGVR